MFKNLSNFLFITLLTIFCGCSSSVSYQAANEAGLKDILSSPFSTVLGRDIRISQYRGKIVMLHFLSSWCPECGMEAPTIRNLANNFSQFKFSVVSVAVHDDPFNLQNFVTRHNLNFPVIIDMDGALENFFQIKALPTTIFLDETGKPIRFRDPQNGEMTAMIVGARLWDTEKPVEMIAQLVEKLR